jgi:hypothetical protein
MFGKGPDPMSIPAAYQVVGDYGADTGGVNAALFPDSPVSEFDSWLTLGTTDGTVSFSMIGIDFPSWTSTSDMVVDDGAILVFPADADSASGPTVGDGPIAIAQITIPTSADVTVLTANFQGHTQDRSLDVPAVSLDDMTNDWQHMGVVFELSNTAVVQSLEQTVRVRLRHQVR